MKDIWIVNDVEKIHAHVLGGLTSGCYREMPGIDDPFPKEDRPLPLGATLGREANPCILKVDPLPSNPSSFAVRKYVSKINVTPPGHS